MCGCQFELEFNSKWHHLSIIPSNSCDYRIKNGEITVFEIPQRFLVSNLVSSTTLKCVSNRQIYIFQLKRRQRLNERICVKAAITWKKRAQLRKKTFVTFQCSWHLVIIKILKFLHSILSFDSEPREELLKATGQAATTSEN